MTIRLHGISPDGRAPRVLDINRLSERRGGPGISVWIHSPDSRTNGWEIKLDREELARAIDRLLISESW